MAAEPWIPKIRKKKKITSSHPSPYIPASSTVGILSFEVAAAMSRAVHLHRSLSDAAISHLRTDTIPSIPLLSPSHLLALALAEKLDDLNRIAATAARLGRRCAHPALLGFEHVYADLLAGRIPDLAALGFLSKDIESTIRRMDRLISSTSILYSNLETLTELEHSAKKFPATADARRVLDHKIQWQRHDIKLLRDGSLWNQSFDKAVLLLARAVCTIHSRICFVFGETAIRLDSLFPKQIKHTTSSMPRRRHIPIHSGQIFDNSGPIGLPESDPEPKHNCSSLPKHNCSSLRFRCAANPGRLLMDCLSLGRATAFDNDVCLPQSVTGALPLPFGPKSRLLSLAPPSTVGGSALALHYANVVIIIEKLLRYPHLVGEEARDDLYQMLPSSLRSGLRRSLKAYANNMSIYDAPLAHDWKDAMEKILCWLAPMAHNMIRWQTERNFEQQQIVLRENVLLLETLYFADRVKTEEAICELLVGLNYVCRYEQQQNALVDCRSSVDFDDCMDWQVQY